MTDQELAKIEHAHMVGERGGDRALAHEHRGLLIEELKAERAQRQLFEDSSQEARQLAEEYEERAEAAKSIVDTVRAYREAPKGSKAEAAALHRLLHMGLPGGEA